MTNLSQNEISIKRFRKGKRISRGGFGIVYEVKDIKTGKLYAAKLIDCGDDEAQCNKIIDREIGVMICAKHPTIINFIGYSKLDFQNENNITIIMELAENGSLHDILKRIKNFDGPKDYTDTTRQIIITGIARGMKYLHDHNIIHRDLKTANILLDSNSQPHITDFGLSKKFDMGHSDSQSLFGGTLIYEAPEIFQKKPYNRKVDVYAFAIIMYEILTDSVPYPELERGELPDYEFKSKVINEFYRPKFNVPIKKSLRQLIEKCWSNDPQNRPSFREIFSKLSNIRKEDNDDDDDDDDYLLEGVNVDEFNAYVEDITDEADQIEKLLDQIEVLEKDSYQSKAEIKELKDENKRQSETISRLEKEKQKLKEEIIKLKKNEIKEHYALNTIPASDLPYLANFIQWRRIVDICFVIDSTSTMRDSFYAITNLVNDAACEFRFSFRRCFLRQGCVILRDPKSNPTDDMHSKTTDDSFEQKKQRRKEKLIAHGCWDEEFEKENERIKLEIDRNKYPINKTVPIQFNDLESIIYELRKVECGGGNDAQKDWAGALECAIEELDWIDISKKVIIFISDSNAHGKRFCGIDDHDINEEKKLVNIIRSLANQKVFFIGYNASFNNSEGCSNTLKEIRNIFGECGGGCYFDNLSMTNGNEYLGDDYTEFDKSIEFDLPPYIDEYLGIYHKKPLDPFLDDDI